MINILLLFVSALLQLLFWLVIISVILSYFIDPYNPIRRSVDSVVEPMLAPIRRVVPLIGMFDFSPLILLLIIQLLQNLINRLSISL